MLLPGLLAGEDGEVPCCLVVGVIALEGATEERDDEVGEVEGNKVHEVEYEATRYAQEPCLWQPGEDRRLGDARAQTCPGIVNLRPRRSHVPEATAIAILGRGPLTSTSPRAWIVHAVAIVAVVVVVTAQ